MSRSRLRPPPPPGSRRRRRRRADRTTGRLDGAVVAVTSAVRDGHVRLRRPMRALAVFVLLVTALAVATPLSQAQTPTPVKLVSNAASSIDGRSATFQAQSFTTGSTTGGYTLSEVRVHLSADQNSNLAPAVKIRENNASNKPGDVVAVLTNPATLTKDAFNTFTAPANTTLSASTVYWVYVNDGVTVSSNRGRFSRTNSNSETGLAGWSIANTRQWKFNEGASWTSSDQALVMEVKGYATTNPTTTTTTTTTAPANRAPSFGVVAYGRRILENTAANAHVGPPVPVATDADGDTLTYSMVGTDSASFTFDPATRQITTKTGVTYDYETKDLYEVEIRVSDGTASNTVAIAISLVDVAEQPSRPAAPSVSATSGSTTSLNVAWSAPGRNGGPALTGYSVQYRAGSSGVFRAWSHSGTSTSATITGLTANTSYQVQVRALNGETPSAWSPSGTGRTNTPANSAPVFAAASLTRSVAENTAANTNVGAAVPAATDANSDSLTYSMEGTDSGSFSFDAATRQIKTKSGVTYDFETKTSYSVTIKVSDGTASDTLPVTITLTDVAEQPATPAAPSVSATSGSTTSVDVAWTAPGRNGGPALTGYSVQYRVGSSGVFRAWSHSGTSVSATITGLTANTSYQVQVRALNGETPSAWSPSGTGRTNSPANSAPVFAAASLTRSLAENTAANTNVGAAVPAATDADSGDTLTYSMEGTDSGSFAFDAATRRIKTRSGVTYDFETKTSYSVTIKASDGTASDTVTVTINLTDLAEQPARPAAPSVSATSGSTTSVDVAWTAPARNGGPALTGYNVQYRAGSSGVFRAWSHSGTSVSATITGLTANTSYQVQVRALNGETPSAWSPSGTGRTNTPANSAPVFAAASLTRSVAENTAANTNVGAVVPAATDANGDTLTYSMEGTDSGSFSFDAATRRIKTRSGVTYDFETKTSYSVTIKVSDGTASDTVTVTITLTDVAEQPATPAAPSVSATSGSTTSLNVAWGAPARNGGPVLTGYNVQYRAGSSGVFRAWSHSGTSVSATITGLTANTSYQVQIRALNGETPSAWSPSGTGRTNSPTNSAPVFAAASLTRSLAENTAANTNVGAAVPAATDADSGDTLTYSMEGANSASFAFDAATRRIKTRSGVTYDFETKTSYSVTIKASDGTASDTVPVTINLTDVAEAPARPAAPSVSATSGSTTSLNVAWTAPARNGGPALTGYNVQYRAGSSGVFRAWSHSGTSVSATITGLTANTGYQVQIRALNGETPSAWSPSGTGPHQHADQQCACQQHACQQHACQQHA